MATIKIPKKEIEKHVRLTEENLNKINMMGIPIESITNEYTEVEVMPNRADVLSVQGFIRAYKSFLNRTIPKYETKKPEKGFMVKIDKSVKDVRPYTVCAVIKNLKLNDEKIREIIDVQEKLHATLGRNRKKAAIGIYPLEKISLPIRYEARKPQEIKFIPLESTIEMNAMQILQQHPKGRDYANLLEGKEKFPIFIDSKEKILSMPPIINSEETGKVTENTKDLFIECSGFDFNVLNKILNILATMFADMGGTIYQMELQYEKKILTPNLEPEKMKVSLKNVNKLLGLDLREKDIEKLLPKMGYSYKKGIALIPAWRTDILHEVDVIEDIAIAYGYDNLIPEIPKVSTIGQESNQSKIIRKITDTLIGLGLLEISTYHLVKEDEDGLIELENSKTEYKLLRNNLLIPALRTISENKDNEYPQRIFEIGTVFNKGKSETGIEEKENLQILTTNSNFTEIKQILDYLMRMLNLNYILEETKNKYFIPGRTAKIIINKKEIGIIGEIHPETLERYSLDFPIATLELNVSEIA